MIRVVIDTNIVVSAMLRSGGLPEFELRLTAGADERGHLLVADRRSVDGGLHVEERLGKIQLACARRRT